MDVEQNFLKRWYRIAKGAMGLPDRGKSWPVILAELFMWRIVHTEAVQRYFLYGLHRVGSNPELFIKTKEYYAIERRLRPRRWKLLEDKYQFGTFCGEHGIPVPRTLCLLRDNRLHWLDGRPDEPLSALGNHRLDVFLKRTTGCGGRYIFKLTSGSGAVRVNGRIVNPETIPGRLGGDAILQERIRQHPSLERLNPHAVNTLRIVTIHRPEGIGLFSYLLRIGTKSNYRDNHAQGGLLAGIFRREGRLLTYAMNHDLGYRYPIAHPDTGVPFSTVDLPGLEEALEMTVRFHRDFFDDFFSIGWDIALAQDGPLVIEANSPWDFRLNQRVDGPFRNPYLAMAKRFAEKRGLTLPDFCR